MYLLNDSFQKVEIHGLHGYRGYVSYVVKKLGSGLIVEAEEERV